MESLVLNNILTINKGYYGILINVITLILFNLPIALAMCHFFPQLSESLKLIPLNVHISIHKRKKKSHCEVLQLFSVLRRGK